MSDIRAIVIGQSHIVALRKAAEDLPEDFGLALAFLNLNAGRPLQGASPVRANSKYSASEMIGEFQPDVIVSCIGGNAHTIFGLLEHPTRFDFVFPDEQNLSIDRDRQLVPFNAVQQMLESRMREELDELAGLRQFQEKPWVHLESPPIIPSEAHIQKYPGAFQELMEERGVTPASIRHKLWQLHSSIFRRTCAEHDIHFLPVPAKAQDDCGMLVERAWNRDPTHANEWYGRLVLNQLKDFFPGVMK